MLSYAIANASAATPQRVLLTTRAQVFDALLGVLANAQREVRVMAQDLAIFELGNRSTVEALERLLLSGRRARVRLLADDVQWVETRAPRLKQLQRAFSHALQIRAAATEDAVGDEACVLVDGATSLRLEHAARALGEVWLYNEGRVQPLLTTFERRWDTAAHDIAVAPLGL
jgi:hypothetical protein